MLISNAIAPWVCNRRKRPFHISKYVNVEINAATSNEVFVYNEPIITSTPAILKAAAEATSRTPARSLVVLLPDTFDKSFDSSGQLNSFSSSKYRRA